MGGFKRGKVAPLARRRFTAASSMEEEGGRLAVPTIVERFDFETLNGEQ
jgi:hypothetical protein